MNEVEHLEIFTRLRENNPHPTTELNFGPPFELLIAILLFVQVTDVSVNKVTAKLHPVANTSTVIHELGVERMKIYIKTIGLYSSEVESIIKACRTLLERHDGEVPGDRVALETLPGVGRKTADVALSTAFGRPIIAANMHIFRICNCAQFAPRENVEQVEEKLLKTALAESKADRHHQLILHGRYTCTARKPYCGSCIIEDPCEYKEKVNV